MIWIYLFLAVLLALPLMLYLWGREGYRSAPEAVWTALAAGAACAIPTAVLEIVLELLIPIAGQSEAVQAIIVAPVVEEAAKLLAAILVWRALSTFPANGALVGAAVGVGFAILENAGYAAVSFREEGSAQAIVLLLIRTAFGTPLHVSCSMLAAAIVLRRGQERMPYGKMLAAYGLAVGLHAASNGLAVATDRWPDLEALTVAAFAFDPLMLVVTVLTVGWWLIEALPQQRRPNALSLWRCWIQNPRRVTGIFRAISLALSLAALAVVPLVIFHAGEVSRLLEPFDRLNQVEALSFGVCLAFYAAVLWRYFPGRPDIFYVAVRRRP